MSAVEENNRRWHGPDRILEIRERSILAESQTMAQLRKENATYRSDDTDD